MNKLSAEQRIQKSHVRIMGHPSTLAFSGLVMVGTSEVRDDIPTAMTNGRDRFYGRSFVESLTDQEVVGVVLHELLHVAYQHNWLWGHLWKQDPKRANIAADLCINQEIKDLEQKHRDFIKLPDAGLYDPQYKGLDTGEIYRRLKEQGEDGGEGGFDEHDFDQLSDEEKEVVGAEIDQAIRQGALLAGKMGGEESRLIQELTAPKIDWREQLREFMSAVSQGHDDSTWRRPNRRWLGEDLYMPSSISESMGCLVVGIDTSGSITGELVSSFLSEVVGICQNVQPEVLHLIECDAKVQSHKVFDSASLSGVESIRELHGGGGTDMREIFKLVATNQLKPEAIIVLTDMETPFPTEVPCPTLWASTSKHIKAPVGATICLD